MVRRFNLSGAVVWMLLAGAGFQTAGVAGQEPVGVQLDGLVNIRFRHDIRVFSVMAALNAAGFGEGEAADEGSLRAELRAELEIRLDPELKKELSDYYRESLTRLAGLEHPQGAYTSLALLLSPPPAFELVTADDQLPSDAFLVRDFTELLRRFYGAVDAAGLFEKYRVFYERELEAYRPVFQRVIVETLRYFRIPARVVLDRQIVLIADLLDQKNLVNARNQEKTYYLVLGPTDDPTRNRAELRHEYLHFILDPLIQKQGLILLEHENLLDLAQRQPGVRESFQNRFLLMVTESLIECLALRLDEVEGERLERELVALFREGLVMAPWFNRMLSSFEAQQTGDLPSFLSTRLAELETDTIREDEKQVAESEQRFRTADLAVQQEEDRRRQAELQRQAIRVLFDQATEQMRRQGFQDARASLEKVLELDPDHGDSHFYLGQIAMQNREFDQALVHFGRSAAATNVTPQVRAWSHLRLGRIHASRQEFAQARQEFQQVIDMRGEATELVDARREAGDLLKRLPPQ